MAGFARGLPHGARRTLATVRALLIYPALPATYWSMTHALSFIGKKASTPPRPSHRHEQGTPFVAGGPFPTSGHERIRGVDHFVLAEAELTLPRFLADSGRGRAERVYRDATRPDLALTPAPRYELVELRKYSTMAVKGHHFFRMTEIVVHEGLSRPPG